MKKLLIILLSIMSLSIMAQVNQVWDQMSNFTANGRHHPITFSNDNYGFVMSGSYLDDVYKYDKLNDTWSQLQNIPFSGRGYAYGVSSGDKAYMGFGSTSSGSHPTDWWEYDMDNDIWNQKASFPGSGRKHPAMIVVNNKIYMGCGNNNNGNLGDWWEYDISNDLWTQKADFPAIERHHPYYFNINNLAYVGFGHSNTGILKDFYQYDPSNDTWTQLNDFPGEGRVAGTQFSYNGKGYILSGDGDDHGPLDSGEFWEYESLDDSWTQLTSHPEGARWAPGSFVIDCDVYFLLGYNHATNSFPLTIYKYKLSEDCGCTDPTACNYDASANVDDGSCDLPNGCGDPLYLEYDATVTCSDASSCLTLIVNGCTDPTAFNYDPGATVDDGSCIPFFYGCTDPVACNYDPNANTDDGNCIYSNSVNTELVTLNLYDSFGDGWGDGCVFCLFGSECGTFGCIEPGNSITINGQDYGGNDFSSGSIKTYNLCLDLSQCIDVIFNSGYYASECSWDITDGLGNILASGADNSSQVGCCNPSGCIGCTDPTAFNYDANANIDDGSCLYPGCTDSTACNYDPNANIDDGSCYGAMGCMDTNACNYNQYVCYDDGSCLYPGCTDSLANNYDPSAVCDDSSCTYSSSSTCDIIYPVTGLYVDGIIDDRVVLHFDNMNTYDANGDQICRVDQIRIRYRELGTSAWSQKNIASPTGYDANGICNSTQKTDKNLYGLTLATTYEWRVKLWYCSGQVTGWVNGPNFTTADECPNVGNLTAYGSTPTRATFDWDASNGVYEFARIKSRVDSISDPQGSDWFLVGGFGVPYGTNTKNKNGLTPGETYRGQARTWCDPAGGAYNSLSWTPLVTWTQPTNRIEGGESIKNLDIYPNPSRDVFNVTFASDDVQDLIVVVRNIIGEELIIDDLQQFVGEYVKSINLKKYSKGVYFLEIETNKGVINKKLILQ